MFVFKKNYKEIFVNQFSDDESFDKLNESFSSLEKTPKNLQESDEFHQDNSSEGLC